MDGMKPTRQEQPEKLLKRWKRVIAVTAVAAACATVATVAAARTGTLSDSPSPSDAPRQQQAPAVEPDSASTAAESTEEPQDVETYWTEERMRDAEPN